MKTPLETRIAKQAIRNPDETWRDELLETAFSSQARSGIPLSMIALPILWSVIIGFIIATPDTSRATTEVAERLNSNEPLRLVAMAKPIVQP